MSLNWWFQNAWSFSSEYVILTASVISLNRYSATFVSFKQNWVKATRELKVIRPKETGKSLEDGSMETQGPTLRHVFEDFAQYTTAHGIHRIEASPSTTRKCLWILVCIAAYSYLIYSCHCVLRAYLFEKPLSTSISVSYEKVRDKFLPYYKYRQCQWWK